MHTIVLVGMLLVASLVMGVVAGHRFYRAKRERRSASLQLAISRLQTALNQFLIDKRSELTPNDLRLANELLLLKGKSVARTRRLFRSYRYEQNSSSIIGITRHAIDGVEPVIEAVHDPDLRCFYRQYQRLLLEGLEHHLPAGELATWVSPQWRMALLPKANSNRGLHELEQWYARRVYELR